MRDDTDASFEAAGLDPVLLDRILSGECTAEEAARFAEWRRAEPRAAYVIDRLRKGFQARKANGMFADADVVVERVAKALDIDHEAQVAEDRVASGRSSVATERATSRRLGRSSNPIAFARRAGGIFVGTTVTAIAVFIGWQRRTSAPIETQTYSTATGQQATVSLRDGSRAILGPATTMRVSSNGSGTTVNVDGRVLFTVTRHADAPFVVRTANSVTRVLGTTFEVRRYASDRATRVSIADGRVSVQRPSSHAITLSALMAAIVSDSGVHVIPNVATDEITGWTNGRLVFRDTPVRDMLADINRAYGVELRLADSSFVDRKLTCTIPVGSQSLDNVLDGLGTLLDARVTRAGRVITLTPGGRTSRRAAPFRAPFTLSPESQYGK